MPKGSISRAKTLIGKINKELDGLEYSMVPAGADRPEALAYALKTGAVALRRAARSLKGEESVPSLKAKRERMQDIASEAEELRNTVFNLGSLTKKEMSELSGFEPMTSLTKAEFLKQKAEKRKSMMNGQK